MIRKLSLKRFRGKGGNRRSLRGRDLYRHPCFEPLESRQLLSVSLAPIENQTMPAGPLLNIPLDGSEDQGHALSYTVSIDNVTLSNPNVTDPQLTATFSQGNPSIKISIDNGQGVQGDMVLQLFEDLVPATVDKIMNLVDQGFYNGLIFHRVIKDFMIQGGDPKGDGSGGPDPDQYPGYPFDDEFNASLQFTSDGLLAMANSGRDTNGSQFFITTALTRWLDFNHTIFGALTEGMKTLQAAENVSVHLPANPQPNEKPSIPDYALTMTSVTRFTDVQNAVLRLSVPDGTSGGADLTVTATDPQTQKNFSQTFHVTIAPDTNDDPAFLENITPIQNSEGTPASTIQTSVDTPVSFSIRAHDVEGSTLYYYSISTALDEAGQLTFDNNGKIIPNDDLTVSLDQTTGEATLTPQNGISGVFGIQVGAASETNDTWDTQLIPVYINPAAPAGITLQAESDTGSSNTDKLTNLNNTPGKTLQFQVDGVMADATVELFADGVLIGEAPATGTTATVTTNGTATLADGNRLIIAKQILKNQEVNVGNLRTTTNLISTASSSLAIMVDTTPPEFNFTPITSAEKDILYTCYVTTTEGEGSGITYQLDEKPTGMTIDANTGQISWTPGKRQGGIKHVVVQATDPAGNSATKAFDIEVPNTAPELTPATNVQLLGNITEDDSPITVPLTDFLVDGALDDNPQKTRITDADEDVVGGIALFEVIGNGTWKYSTDGTNFSEVGTVSPDSALLLAPDAFLRYTPDGKNGETAIISYRAWDMTSGTNGTKADVTTNGGKTAFSEKFDTATIDVADVNDAPVLNPASPSLGNISSGTPLTISLTGSFINNGPGTTEISDVDLDAVVGGIALVGVTGGGTWKYSTDGSNFSSIVALTEKAALLLTKEATLRYTPGGTNNETATITYRAWDAPEGEKGGNLVDTTTHGGTTLFSTDTDTASLWVNDAPVLTPVDPSLGSTDEDTALAVNLSAFISTGANTAEQTIITDPNENAVVGGIALIGTTGKGTWAYSINGSDFSDVGAVANDSALLLPQNAVLRYTPDGKSSESAAVVYRAWDTTSGQNGTKVNATVNGGTTAFSTATDTATLSVIGVNDAPVLEPAQPSLGNIAPNADTTVLLTAFINNGSGTTIITDADPDDVLGGIALIGTTGDGIWKYSLNGTTFTSVGTVSESSALLLPKDVALRYTAGGTNAVTPSITYRAWDATSGAEGDRVDLSFDGAVGGVTAFSSETDTASFTLAVGSLTGYVYIDANNDGLRTCSNGRTHLALPGVTIRLFSQDDQGAWVETAGKSPAVSGADGSYRFDSLASGTYRILEDQPSDYLDGIETAGSGLATQATAGNDYFDIQLGAGEEAVEYNFGERGLRPEMISMAFFLASYSPSITYTPSTPVAPVVDLSASASGTGYQTTIKAGSSPVSLAAPDATITDADSSLLTSLTSTITNPLDGDYEKLAAEVSGTSLASAYSNGVLTISGAASLAIYNEVLRSLTYSNSAISPQTGSRYIHVVVSDGSSNSQPATATVTVTSGPSNYTIVANNALINAANTRATGFTFTGAEVGATYAYTVTSDGGDGSVTGNGTISSASQSVTDIDVSSLPDGTLTFSVTLTDTVGNVGDPATATAFLDKTTPANYGIVPDDDPINATTASATGFTLTDAEVGTTYRYSVSSLDSEEVVSGTGLVTSTTQHVTGINVSSLPDGTLIFSVTLTDAVGNVGDPATATAFLDKTTSADYTILPDADPINATTASATGFTLTGAEVGATYAYTVTSDGGDGSVTGNGTISSASQSVTGIDVSSLSDGILTFSVTVTDTAGNVGDPATAKALLDTTPPSGFSIVPDNTVVDASTSYTTGFTFDSAEVGASYLCRVSSKEHSGFTEQSGTVYSTTQHVTGIDLSDFDEGVFRFFVTLTDAAGNTSMYTATADATLNKTPLP
jgi:cyclophilin family peptidyl-prolyl cis-trans isomerase